MSKYFQIIHDILESKGEEYETRFPEVRQKNVFTISTLSHSSASQVYWKLKGNRGTFSYESITGKAFFEGRSKHEYIQKRLVDCITEYPLEFKTEKYKLIGHIDAIDFNEKFIMDLKTTKLDTLQLGRLREYVLQVGAYCKLMEIETGRKYNGSVFVLNGKLTEYELTREDIDNSWTIIIKRADETYQKLKELGQIRE